MNNSANALLAVGASPIMAHAEEETKDLVRISNALVLNIGTLSPPWVQCMLTATKVAKTAGIPVVFDPVGAGASDYRTKTCLQLIKENTPSIIRGNASEILALAAATGNINSLQYNLAITGTGGGTKGGDSQHDAESLEDTARHMANSLSTTITISGEVDVISDGNDLVKIRGGHEMMPYVTGLGCTSTVLCGAFVGISESPFRAQARCRLIYSTRFI